MTITIKSKRSGDGKTIVFIELEKTGLYYARVYENIGNWILARESWPADNEKQAIRAFYRYTGKYIKDK